MKYLFLLLLLGCSTNSALEKKLDPENSFAFISQGKKYYFARAQTVREDKICNSYIGLIDGKRVFKFSATHFEELNTIYESKKSPEERISIALDKIEHFSNQSPNEVCMKKLDWKEGIVWASFGIVVWPVTLIAASGELINHVTDSMDDVALNMTLDDMFKTLKGYELKKREQDGRTYYVANRNKSRMVMYFSNDKLTAYVRGMNPDYWRRPR